MSRIALVLVGSFEAGPAVEQADPASVAVVSAASVVLSIAVVAPMNHALVHWPWLAFFVSSVLPFDLYMLADCPVLEKMHAVVVVCPAWRPVRPVFD